MRVTRLAVVYPYLTYPPTRTSSASPGDPGVTRHRISYPQRRFPPRALANFKLLQLVNPNAPRSEAASLAPRAGARAENLKRSCLSAE
eukprot:1180877-Prorocentrum_minimum.AAC.1